MEKFKIKLVALVKGKPVITIDDKYTWYLLLDMKTIKQFGKKFNVDIDDDYYLLNKKGTFKFYVLKYKSKYPVCIKYNSSNKKAQIIKKDDEPLSVEYLKACKMLKKLLLRKVRVNTKGTMGKGLGNYKKNKKKSMGKGLGYYK